MAGPPGCGKTLLAKVNLYLTLKCILLEVMAKSGVKGCPLAKKSHLFVSESMTGKLTNF